MFKRIILLVAGGAIVALPAVGGVRGKIIHAKRELGPSKALYSIPIVWQSECNQPAGQGLTLDGIDQRYEDSRPHTRVLSEGVWTNIYPRLKSANPLQDHCERAKSLAIDLMRARARARHIWFKGLDVKAERVRLDREAVPPFHAFLSGFEKFVAELKAAKGLPEYEAGQVAFALRHFEVARETLRTAEAVAKDVLAAAHIDAMEKAQTSIEIGAEALDAEPPPRVLSVPAYDAKTGLYVIFGGDHFDYLTNDTWVFDPKIPKWFQRHPENAPPLRAKHTMEAPGDGTVKMKGGYYYSAREGYTWIGEDVWTYDITGNAWSGPDKEKKLPPDTRAYRGGAEHPSHFLQGPKPDAAAHEKVLQALPDNTWVDMKPPYKRAGWRPWGTMAYDPEHDLIVDWNGGHSGYCSTDAPHYHLGVNRWELPYPAEIPLGLVGASAAGVGGYSFNRRHWITNHTWNHYLYDPKLKRVLVAGSMSNWQWKWDPYSYIYDPVLGEWESRFRKTGGLERAFPASISMVFTSKGALAFDGNWWSLNYEKMTWDSFARLGKDWPFSSCSDWYGQVYDPDGNRVLALALPMPNGAYKGETIHALDLATRKSSVIKPQNPEVLGDGFRFNREWRYIPDLKITICGGNIVRRKANDKKIEWINTDDMPAYDPVNNRWLVLKLKGAPELSFSGSMHYDESRRVLWALDNRGGVKALRLNLAAAIGQGE